VDAPDGPAATSPPRWPWVVILLLALTQPALHWVIVNAPPAGYFWTGLSISDSALFLESMERLGQLDFRSSYATCQSDWGGDDPRYYAVPHLWLYGALGFLARLFGLSDFTMLGIANGLAFAFYLAMVWRFLCAVVPKLAQPAFLLFTLSGGIGGVLWVLCRQMDWIGHPEFGAYFFRYSVYGLMEGPHFHPLLYAPRCYYTLALGIVFGALAAVRQGMARGSLRPLIWWLLALVLGTFVYARMGVFSLGILALMLACSGASRAMRAKLGLLFATPVAVGAVLSALVMRTNPQVIDNHLEVASMAMWLTPALVVCGLHIAAGAPVFWRGILHSRPVRAVAGYLGAYTLLALAYMAYYGTLLTANEGMVAARVSDPALIGLLAGLLPNRKSDDYETPWWLLWLLGVSAVAVSGWGQGWFLRFGPQRLQLLIWLPLCIAAAAAISKYSRVVRVEAYLALVLLGLASIAVTLGAYQSDLMAGTPSYHRYTYRHDLSPDGAFSQAFEGETGTILAPLEVSDALVRASDLTVVYGVGTFNLTDVDYMNLRARVRTFFSRLPNEADRREFVEAWCVDWIYLPDYGLPPTVRSELIEAHWTVLEEEYGSPVLRVLREENK